MSVHRLENAAESRALADHLMNPNRERVVVVVSTRSKDDRQMYDAVKIGAGCGSHADVWVLPAGRAGLEFSNALPEHGSVFGGATRVYPQGDAWLDDLRSATVYFAFDDEEAASKLEWVIERAIKLSYFAPGPRRSAPPLPPRRVVAPGPGISAGLSAVVARTPRPRPVPPMPSSCAPARPGVSPDAVAPAIEDVLHLERLDHDDERRRLDGEIALLRKKLSDALEQNRVRAAAAKRRRSVDPDAPGAMWLPELFLDPVDAVRHAIALAWVERVPAAEKAAYALPSYKVGPDFAASIEALDPAAQPKALKCAVDVLTDRARDMASRRVHALRTGGGGGDGRRVRADGAVCFRANIETATASARRLHWWKSPDGSIELSRVVIHDDMDA